MPGAITRHGATATVTFPTGAIFDHLMLCEDLSDGQRIRHHTIRDAMTDTLIAEGHTVASQRYHPFPNVTADRIEIELDHPDGRLESVDAHLTGVESVPELEPQPAFMSEKVMAW